MPSYVSSVNLVGWWQFCGNANDESGNAHHGTPMGAILTTDRFGNVNNAYSLNGITNSIFVNDNFFNAGWNEFTISGWYYLNVLINTNNSNLNQAIFNTAPHNGLELGSNWGNSQKHNLLGGTGNPATSWNVMMLTPSTQTLTIGTWKYFTFTKSGASYSLYIDGVLDKTITSSSSVVTYLYKMYFGNTDPAIINEGVLGKIDDYGIWNRKLTQTEITDLYTGSSPCTTTTTTTTNNNNNNNTISVLPLPNVITPNSDGANDYVDFVKHVSEKEFDFEIYDRWRLLMMKSNSA